MSGNSSFLPEDYLRQKREVRTNVISLLLFAVVMVGTFMAFVVTNRKWTQVKDRQAQINGQYQDVAIEITELMELEQQKEQMLDRAELAAALVERVPRSILLAELINRMPPQLSLLQFELESEKIRTIVREPRATDPRSGRVAPGRRGVTKKEMVEDNGGKIEPPRYRVGLVLVGVAPTDLEVSRYLAELNAYGLLHDIALDYSEETEIDGATMREFRITMKLDPAADIRDVDPLERPRDIDDPMTDTLRIGGVGG